MSSLGILRGPKHGMFIDVNKANISFVLVKYDLKYDTSPSRNACLSRKAKFVKRPSEYNNVLTATLTFLKLLMGMFFQAPTIPCILSHYQKTRLHSFTQTTGCIIGRYLLPSTPLHGDRTSQKSKSGSCKQH